MLTRLQNLLTGAALALALIAPGFAHADTGAGPRLYADSQLVVRDRFSDEIVGTGPDLVFIPGLASSRATWKATADRLKDRYRVHLIQVAGFAGEPARANASGPVLAPTAEVIDAYLVEQHLTPATLIGHSLGGTMILYLATHHGADLKKAMVVDALPFYAVLMAGPNATADGMKPMADGIRAGTSKMSDQQRAQMLASMATAQSDKDTIAAWGKASDAAAVGNAMADDLTLDLRPDIAKIATPITLLQPDYAPVGAPPGSTHGMYAASYAGAPSVKVVEVANSVHFIMLDQPAAFAAALDTFLSQ